MELNTYTDQDGVVREVGTNRPLCITELTEEQLSDALDFARRNRSTPPVLPPGYHKDVQ